MPSGFSDAFIRSNAFLNTPEWKRLRYDTIEKYGAKCRACGLSPKDGIAINVDHIKPRKLRPDLALDPRNCQPLCHLCNAGKGNRYQTSWL